MGETLTSQDHQSALVRQEPQSLLYHTFEEALQTDEYEVALQATNALHDLQDWRKATKDSPFPQFYQLFEVATRINGLDRSGDQKKALREEVVATLFPKTRELTPRVRDLYEGLLSELDGALNTPQFPITERQIEELKESGDLRVLQDPSIPWGIKLNRMQNRIESELLGRKALDRRDKKIQEEKKPSEQGDGDEPPVPPQVTDESKPSMEEMSRLKEGEQAQAIWTIKPAYGGYFKEQSFDTWDAKTNTWRQSGYRYDVAIVTRKSIDPISVTAVIPKGRTARVPTPYTYEFLGSNNNIPAYEDQNGDYLITGGDVTPVIINFTHIGHEAIKGTSENPKLLTFPATYTPATEQKLRELQDGKKTTPERVRALRTYVMQHLQYSNDSSYNTLYENYPDGYINAIDTFKKADCDVANTYFAALCTKLGIPVRHVVGHMVKGKDSDGNSRITSGTGHAWSEVWDKDTVSWMRIDATPAGDPQQEQEDQSKSESARGDYGEGPEAIMPSDETLQELEEKLSQLTEMLSYTPEERSLSDATGVELKEARQIVKEIQQAEDTRLPNGERVVDAMSQLFSLIVESRKTTVPDYTGPVRKREGGDEIDDIVTHKIGILGGDTDPASRRVQSIAQHEEKIFGGLDVYMIGDKSGSMSQTVDGETKWQLQRRAEYLIFSSLHRFDQNLQRASIRITDPLSVRTQAISFRDTNTIDVDKELTNSFSPVDKVKLWKSMGNQGMGNGDVAALNYVFGQIEQEQAELLAQGKYDDKLRVIVACSDGMPDSVKGVHTSAQKLGELNSVVVGVGLTETASQVPIIFDTPYSKGDIANDINSLPSICAKHIVSAAIKLFPDRALPAYQKQIDSILAKFDRVGLR